MSGQRLPVFIDPIRMADTGTYLTGSMTFEHMNRLHEILAEPSSSSQSSQSSSSGDVSIELTFGVDVQGYRYIEGHIKTQVALICQRCMQVFNYLIDSKFILSPVSDDVAAKQLPSPYEPLLATEKMLLSTIIEDEILLNLPVIARHEEGECFLPKTSVVQPTTSVKPGKTDNPFKKLAELRKKKS